MASTLPARGGQTKPVFIPPKRRTASGKSSANTPTKSIYGDQILNVQGRSPGSADCLLEQDRDVLGSLERLERAPTGSIGTMRSIRSNGSIPTLERVRREESNHSIGSHSQTSSGQVSERSTDIDLVREAVHTKRSHRRQGRTAGGTSSRRTSESLSRLSRSTSRSSQQPSRSANTSTDDLDQVSVVEVVERVKEIQSRPLPQLPEADSSRALPPLPSTGALPPLPGTATNSTSTPVSRKNIISQSNDVTSSPANFQLRVNPEDEAIEILNSENVSIGGPRLNISLKPQEPDSQASDRLLLVPSSGSGFLTVTGTIKRGKNKGECFDVQLRLNQDSLVAIQKETEGDNQGKGCCCTCRRGLHILLMSLLSVPFLWLFCTVYAFYMGTITWYNIFIYYNEQRTCCHTVFVSPCVLLLYPVWILPITLLLGLYGGISQISWNWSAWRREVLDPEKGFYGWICNKLALPDCAPYEVVILSSLPHDPLTVTSIL